MKTIARLAILSALLLSFSLSQAGFASPPQGCVNASNTVALDGVAYVNFTCSLYPSTSSYTIDLTPNLTFGSAALSDNLLGPGYVVVFNGDPGALGADLWNQSLWTAVLYWPGDPSFNGVAADSLTFYSAGNSDFPSVATVEIFDQGLYGTGVDSEFFVQSGNPAVYNPGNNEYDVYPTAVPESSSLPSFLLCGFVLAGAIFLKAKQSGFFLAA